MIPMSSPIRVLHVDDNPDFLETSATVLERTASDLEVVTATSPDAGLDVLEREAIDCIVSDYRMPETDGLAFLDAVRESYPDVPFVLFTGCGSERIASRAISAGITVYLR
jgi:CheY-like chemotaxis protein